MLVIAASVKCVVNRSKRTETLAEPRIVALEHLPISLGSSYQSYIQSRILLATSLDEITRERWLHSPSHDDY
jgi:hypothetical protein